jgi:hypothetical protein
MKIPRCDTSANIPLLADGPKSGAPKKGKIRKSYQVGCPLLALVRKPSFSNRTVTDRKIKE